MAEERPGRFRAFIDAMAERKVNKLLNPAEGTYMEPYLKKNKPSGSNKLNPLGYSYVNDQKQSPGAATPIIRDKPQDKLEAPNVTLNRDDSAQAMPTSNAGLNSVIPRAESQRKLPTSTIPNGLDQLENPLMAKTDIDVDSFGNHPFSGLLGLNSAIAAMLPTIAKNKQIKSKQEQENVNRSLGLEDIKQAHSMLKTEAGILGNINNSKKPIIKMKKLYKEHTNPYEGTSKPVVSGEAPIAINPLTGQEIVPPAVQYRQALERISDLPKKDQATIIEQLHQRLDKMGLSYLAQ